MIPSREQLRGLPLSLGIGTLGGALFFWLSLPLAWMLGAMCFTTASAISGVRLGFWMPLRTAMITVIGTLLGSAFRPEILQRIVAWSGGVVVTVLFVLSITAAIYVYYRRLARQDRASSYFSATPGGLGEMTVVGELEGGNPRVISLNHATRILVVVFVIPFYLRYVEGLPIGMSNGDGAPGALVATPAELGILAGTAVLGFVLGRLLRLPNAQFLGPLCLSALVYMLGLVEGRPPMVLIWIAQVVIGSALGARFVGIGFGQVRRILVVASGSAIVMLSSAILVAKVAAPILGLDPTAMLLALAPGGLAEMTLMALALDIDTAFVSSMHIVRILLVVVAMPLLFRLLVKRRAGNGGA